MFRKLLSKALLFMEAIQVLWRLLSNESRIGNDHQSVTEKPMRSAIQIKDAASLYKTESRPISKSMDQAIGWKCLIDKI